MPTAFIGGHRRVAIFAAPLAAVIAACSIAATPVAEGTTIDFEVVVQDGAVRTSGAECSGASPLMYVHKDAPWWIENADGETVASGVLPAGEAINAFEDDLGVPRVPTFCRMSWTLTLPPSDSFKFRLERGDPVAFHFDPDADQQNIRVIIQ